MLTKRQYLSYAEYVDAQGWKAREHRDYLVRDLLKNRRMWEQVFRAAAPWLAPSTLPLLCLGARTGAECDGATDAGFPALGIDLHPVVDHVKQGDWHDLPYAGQSFANVFCNALDHCYDLPRLCQEVYRVLVAGGRFYIMASNRLQSVEEWLAGRSLEALHWDDSDELRDAMLGYGFRLVREWRRKKWGHYIFEPEG